MLNFEFLLCFTFLHFRLIILYLHAKLGENRMKTDRVIKLYVIFKMPVAAILDFGGDFRLGWNSRLLEAMCLCCKFEQNRSIGFQVIAICIFSK